MSMYSFYTGVSTNKFLEAENSQKLEAEFKPFNILLLRHEDTETPDVAFQHLGEMFQDLIQDNPFTPPPTEKEPQAWKPQKEESKSLCHQE